MRYDNCRRNMKNTAMKKVATRKWFIRAYVELCTNTDRYIIFSSISRTCLINEDRFVESIANESLRFPMKITVIHLHTQMHTFHIADSTNSTLFGGINWVQKNGNSISKSNITIQHERKTTFYQGHLFDKEQCLEAFPGSCSNVYSIPFRL